MQELADVLTADRRDSLAHHDEAQRDLLFYVLRDRETFPNRTGKKFYWKKQIDE